VRQTWSESRRWIFSWPRRFESPSLRHAVCSVCLQSGDGDRFAPDAAFVIGAAHVRAAVFYENIRALAASTLASQGTVLLPWGSDGTIVPLVAGEDVARVSASLLASGTVPPGSIYPLIGEVLALRDIIATFGRVLGRQVRYVEVSDEEWRAAALAQGVNRHAVEHLSNLWRFFRNFPVTLQVTDTIETVTGRKPKTFEEFVREQSSTLT